ncbi:hypothetical protein TNCV_3792141 [Trichonephila clavipes]|nr:hypothetical protein TNCV_3792141 [Trichonephila clavipes]
MDKCVQIWTRNYGALGQTARVCFGVLCANKKKEEVKRDFGDLRIRRSEGRVVNTPLVFKRVLLGRRKKRGDPKGEVEDKRVRERERTERERRRKETERESGRESEAHLDRREKKKRTRKRRKKSSKKTRAGGF